tara:strand:+ start:5742 stop:6002 length:261 start_codon:yes stop_codon:yes gene_type:complete
MDILTFIANLEGAKLLCLALAGLLVFAGPTLIKSRYLARNNLTVDEQLDDRNSWLFFPKQYSFFEKSLLLFVFVLAFFLIIIAVNI